MYWFSPLPVRRQTGVWLQGATAWLGRLDTPGQVFMWAAVAGMFPLLLNLIFPFPIQQGLSAVLLLALALRLLLDGRVNTALVAVITAFVLHCAAAIALARYFPALVAPLMPGSQAYWDQTLYWIKTGIDPEYELANWVPEQLGLVAGISFFSFSSLGAIPFWRGFYEVDWMNYYVGRLLSCSSDASVALGVGWHWWSVCRGIGYTFLICEVVAISLERLSGRPAASGNGRSIRLSLAFSFLLLDFILKYFTMETVRQILFQNLQP
ncbi:MAG: hypothetical protein IT260_00255 [Saprospiraceae bacterium]|nr:hypothetical protein [Saprospiraceae bacterium]